MICKLCGKEISKTYKGICHSCYIYFKNGGKVYNLPQNGIVAFDDDGKCICHICGRSFVKLGNHIKESHNMTIDEYKEKFGLCRNARTTQQIYHETMRIHAFANNMDKKLISWGENTRIKKGETGKRKGKEIRLQEKIQFRNKLKI